MHLVKAYLNYTYRLDMCSWPLMANHVYWRGTLAAEATQKEFLLHYLIMALDRIGLNWCHILEDHFEYLKEAEIENKTRWVHRKMGITYFLRTEFELFDQWLKQNDVQNWVNHQL